MTNLESKWHVKENSAYQKKHPQTNSKQVLLSDNSTLDDFLKEGISFRLVDNVLVYVDPISGMERKISTSAFANKPIGNVANLIKESLLNMANIRWEDPKDVTINSTNGKITIAEWEGTKVVLKEDLAPKDIADGIIIADSKVRDQYKTNGLEIPNLELGKTYFIKLFPYSKDGTITNDSVNSISIDTNSSPLGVINDVTVTAVGSSLFVRFTDPENKTGVYKGQTYNIAEYAGTKIVINKDVAPENINEGTVVQEYTTKNLHSTNENVLKITVPSEGKWFLTIFNRTVLGLNSLGYSTTKTMSFLPLDNVSGFSAVASGLNVTVKWQDPQDKQYFLGTNHTVATWTGTKLVRKKGSEPVNENDGVLLVDNKVRGVYSTNGFKDTSLTSDGTYYYKLFPYTTENVVTNNTQNSTNVKYVIPDDIFGTPGPAKLVAGDMNYGYFGTVPSSELITGSALASQVGLTFGYAQYDNEPWLKFALNGKILFVAKKPLRYYLTWTQLDNLGLVFGTAKINIKNNQYKVRIFKGGYYHDLKTSEWNRLLLPIHIKAKDMSWPPSESAYIDPNTPYWGADFTDEDLHTVWWQGDGAHSWCQETGINEEPNSRLTRGGQNGVISSWQYHKEWLNESYPLSNLGWRPILEVIQ